MPCSTSADRFRAHLGGEGVAVLFLRFAIFGLAQELAGQQRGLARIDHDVILVIDDALELAGGHVQHQAEAARHALEEPDVRDRHGQFDVAHALAAHARQRHFHAATVADDALVLDAFVLSAGAFPVLGRTENAFAEESALFGLEGAVVDRFGFLTSPLLQERMVSGDATVMPTWSKPTVLPRPSISRADSFGAIIGLWMSADGLLLNA